MLGASLLGIDGECDSSNPEVPQTGREPISLSPAQMRDALRKAHPLDQRDPFATDPNSDVRTLGTAGTAPQRCERSVRAGRFVRAALADAKTDKDAGRLLVFYVGKTLIAYRRAREEAASSVDRTQARKRDGRLPQLAGECRARSPDAAQCCRRAVGAGRRRL